LQTTLNNIKLCFPYICKAEFEELKSIGEADVDKLISCLDVANEKRQFTNAITDLKKMLSKVKEQIEPKTP